MRDVAELAGVATMTVSRVLNESAPVTEQVRERVLDAIKQLNYRPNPVARSLRRARSNSIGIIVPNFYDPFFAICAHEVSVVAKKHGYYVTVTTSDERADEEYGEANAMLMNHVEGFVVIPASRGRQKFDSPEFAATHIVALDRPVRGKSIHNVLVENRRGAEEAVNHLIGHGHTRIALVGLSDKLYTLKTRYLGYRKTMLKHGLKPGPFNACATEDEAYEVIGRMMEGPDPPTAIFTANNLTTRHVLCAFSRLNLRIPKDLAVVGFDDFEMADIFNPPLTVVRQPIRELGRVGAELLVARLEGRDVVAPDKPIVLPVELIVRESCGCKADVERTARNGSGANALRRS
jgi:LacI family transcriptional regulator